MTPIQDIIGADEPLDPVLMEFLFSVNLQFRTKYDIFNYSLQIQPGTLVIISDVLNPNDYRLIPNYPGEIFWNNPSANNMVYCNLKQYL